jgi:hypothetical protein
MRYGVWNLLPHAVTFVVERGNRLLGTLTVVTDSPSGLPSSAQYGDEYAMLRREGRIAEVTMFACDPSAGRESLTLPGRLMSLAHRWSLAAGIEDLCFIVNPAHAGFYERVLGCERLGIPKQISHAEGAPGMLLHFPITPNASRCTTGSPETASYRNRAHETQQQSCRRLELQEVEAAVLLDTRPDLYFDSSALQRQLLERLYPRACALLRASYGPLSAQDAARPAPGPGREARIV